MKDEAVEIRLQILRANVLVRSPKRPFHVRPEPVDSVGVRRAAYGLFLSVMHAVPIIRAGNVVELESFVGHELRILR